MRAALLFSLTCLGSCTALDLRLSEEFLQPTRSLPVTPADLGLDHDRVRIPVGGGEHLAGFLIRRGPEARPGVVLLHGSHANVGYFHPYYTFLVQGGYHVLVVDYRGYGESDGRVSVARTAEDIPRVLQWLRARDEVAGQGIVLFGVSLGSTYALRAAAADPRVAAVVVEDCISPDAELRAWAHEQGRCPWVADLARLFVLPARMEPTTNAAMLECPLLVIQGAADRRSVVETSHRTLELAGGPAWGWFPDVAGHAPGPLARWNASYSQLVLDFLDSAMGPQPLVDGAPGGVLLSMGEDTTGPLRVGEEADAVARYEAVVRAVRQASNARESARVMLEALADLAETAPRLAAELVRDALELGCGLVAEPAPDSRSLGEELLSRALAGCPEVLAGHWWGVDGVYRVGFPPIDVEVMEAVQILREAYSARGDAAGLERLRMVELRFALR